MQKKKVGRPSKAMAAAEPRLHERLSDWLQVRRPGTYDQVSGCLLYCRLCETSVKAVRSNNIHWVLQHECTDLHWNKVHSSDSRPCLGVRIHPDLEGKFLIQHYKASLDTWIQEKMPWCHERSSPHLCRADSEGFSWVQSAGCVEAKKQLRGEDLACAACRRLCNNEVFCKRIALWGATFDLVELLHMLYCGQTTRRNEILEGMQSADYAPVLEQTGRVTLQDLRQWTYNQVYELLTSMYMSTPSAFYNSGADSFFTTRFRWLPRSVDPELQAFLRGRRLQRQLDLMAGQSREPAGVSFLHADMARGRANAQETCRTLILHSWSARDACKEPQTIDHLNGGECLPGGSYRGRVLAQQRYLKGIAYVFVRHEPSNTWKVCGARRGIVRFLFAAAGGGSLGGSQDGPPPECRDCVGVDESADIDSHERIPAGSVDAKDLRRDQLAQTVVAYLLHLVCHYRMQPPTPVSQA